MARWFVASNITPADANSLQACPNPGAYTDLDDGDKALVMIDNVLTTYTYDSSSVLAESLPQVITPDGNAGPGRWILGSMAATGQNGFDVEFGPQSDSYATLGVVGTTFTLTHVADYSFYINGVKFTKTANETIEITDVEGIHWIYFDSDGTIQIQAPGGTVDALILYNCIIAAVYWDATNNEALLLFDERHGANMAPATHYHLHETIGASYDEGLALSGFDTDGDGTAATHAQFDLGSGEFHDEDNEINIAADADATIDTFYRLGAGGPWRKITATAGYPVCDPQTGSRMDWNDYNGGDWRLQEVGNNNFVVTHYFATNDVLGGGVIGIMGQGEYSNIVQARTGAETELNALLLGDLPVPELLPIATVIWKTTNGSTNQVAGAIYSVSGGGDYIDWRSSQRTGAAASVSDHESLSGLSGGASADHFHLTEVQHDDLTDGGDSNLHKHDTLNETSGGLVSAEAIEDGIKVFDTTGPNPIIELRTLDGTQVGKVSVTASGFYLLGYNGASYESLFAGLVNGEVFLYYNNVATFATRDGGVDIINTTSPVLNFYSAYGGTKFGTVYHDTSDLWVKNWVHGGEVKLHGFNSTAFGRSLAKFDPDLGASLYDASNVVQFTTRDGYADAPVGLKIGGSTVTADDILDEDDMSSDSATALATQQSIKAYVRDNAGDPALPKLDFYQDWLQKTKYQNSTVVTCITSGTLIDTTTMDHNIEQRRYDFTVGETIQTEDLYDSDLSLTNISECIIDAEITDDGAGTLQVSNDGGSTWVTVTDTTQVVTFTSSGIDLVMKYTAGGTGYVEHMGVLYNPDSTYSQDPGEGWTSKSADFIAVSNYKYLVDTSGGIVTATLPTSPSQGDEIKFVDSAVSFAAHDFVIGRNGHNIDGAASDVTVTTDNDDQYLVYVDETTGWRVLSF